MLGCSLLNKFLFFLFLFFLLLRDVGGRLDR